MDRVHILAALCSLAAPAAALAGVHPPAVEKQLDFIVGDWTIAGHEKTFRESCGWYPDRSFVVCNSIDGESGKPAAAVSILGWSAALQNYTYHHYGQDGRSRSETCFANAQDGLTCMYDRRDGAKLISSRSHIYPIAGGAAEFRNERSENGGPWKETVKFKYVRRKR